MGEKFFQKAKVNPAKGRRLHLAELVGGLHSFTPELGKYLVLPSSLDLAFLGGWQLWDLLGQEL